MKKSRYDIDQSPLYKLYSIKRLCSVLQISNDHLEFLTTCESNFLVFDKVVRGKTRQIEAPKPALRSVHDRLFVLISRISVPDYLHSGVSGRSYITNANAHPRDNAGFTLDIKGFYPNTTWEHIYKGFRNEFRCSESVSKALASLITYQGHLPTGSPVSQAIAFFAHKAMFEKIHSISNSFGGQLTVYVDDLYISISHAKKWQLKRVGRIVTSYGLEWHKERIYHRTSTKVITGVAVTNEGTRLPNSKHRKLADSYRLTKVARSQREKLGATRSLVGQLSTGSQLDERLKGLAQPARGYQKHLERT